MPRPTARVLTLLELLQSGGTRTVAELADRLGVDERTVRRYVDHLIDLDVPVESVRGRYGGYRLAPGLPPASAHAQRRRSARRAARPGRRPPSRADDDGAHGERDGDRPRSGGCCPSSSPAGSTPCSAPSPSRTSPASSPPRTPGSCSRSPTRCATTGRSRSATPTADGRRSERTLHPYGLVAHSGRWYVTGADAGLGEDRTFRLDRIADARTLPGSFEPPAGLDPAGPRPVRARPAPYRHEVTLRIHGTAEQIRSPSPPASRLSRSCRAGGWLRVELQRGAAGLAARGPRLPRPPFRHRRPPELRTLIAPRRPPHVLRRPDTADRRSPGADERPPLGRKSHPGAPTLDAPALTFRRSPGTPWSAHPMRRCTASSSTTRSSSAALSGPARLLLPHPVDVTVLPTDLTEASPVERRVDTLLRFDSGGKRLPPARHRGPGQEGPGKAGELGVLHGVPVDEVPAAARRCWSSARTAPPPNGPDAR